MALLWQVYLLVYLIQHMSVHHPPNDKLCAGTPVNFLSWFMIIKEHVVISDIRKDQLQIMQSDDKVYEYVTYLLTKKNNNK